MQDQFFLMGNLVIMVAYAAIMVAIVGPVAHAGQLRTNRLATATALIFFSCAVGHGLHAAMAYRTVMQVPAAHRMQMDAAGWSWTSAVWDLLTAGVGVYYWTLRRNYGVLLGKGGLYVDPWGQRRLDEADARERAARDVAEAQRAALATVVEHTDDAVVGLTPEGIITAWNGGAERLFGYPAEEALGQPVAVLADATGGGEQVDVLDRIRQGERGMAYETRRLRRDGTAVDVALTITPIHDQAGTVIGASAIARDITAAKEAAEHRRAMEERSNQAQRMESLGKLAGGVAHDFNNILAIIANYTEFVAADTSDRPGVQADLTQVRRAVERATNLTRQLLTFTRAQAVQPEDVDLNMAVTEVQMMLERTIGEHIDLVAVPSTRPLMVHTDPGQLQQVLLNLAINARDAMPEGGTLVLEADAVTLDGEEVDMQPPLPAGTYARLLVSDTGEGMSPETAKRIFEPFYTTKPQGRGTGLGLATVYGIVTEAGGSINVYSELNLGTTFRIYLPLVTAESAAAAAAPVHSTAPPLGGGSTVLVVEDEPALARMVARILSEAEYRVLVAADAGEALDLYEQHGCDALLTDVIMPGISGRRLAESLHERQPDLPVLYMSGYSNGLLGTTHILDEDIAFLEKPFTAADLLHKLAAVRTTSSSQR
ncbi:histidine kinase [Actinoplanes sp. SE50]|uniref:PAS domain-containing sensor histidine kinase n=1 Tax=unclassified Actinoplanes TaxID=2626549 RepID=UPI00023ECB11|nr:MULTISPECIES: PAS domain-containing sensor histidine kinase [unclassified Actinoplanes]AEV84273.1 PAS/PAC sensor hybrid histidine kinase [Actinoplanes sp. SE50/110]ATO82665.1 histidine kinase [Actinoplanes sp. SE50]SLM00072.1 hybrid sensor histidine kinase/response regulator [Actinoplanes sp. SE50/110]